METETNLEAPEVEETELVEEQEALEPELDESGNPIDPEEGEAEPDFEEIDVNGVKHKVPAALKGEFLMQQDYTRKTQELAEQRKAFEAERQQFGELSQVEISAQADVVAIDKALAEFKTIDWQRWQASNPQAAQRAFTDYQLLKDQRQDALGNYHAAREQRTTQEQRASAERLRQGMDTLGRQIPGWGQEKARAILDFGQKQFGFSQAELSAIDDPRVIVVLNAAFEAANTKQTKQIATNVAKQQAVKPAVKVGGGKTPGRPVDDRVSTDAWMKARDAQVAKR